MSGARARRFVVEFFWADDSPVNLGVARIAVFLALLKSVDLDRIANLATLPAELIRVPIGMGWLQALIPTDPEKVVALGWLVRVSALCAAFGFLSRLSACIAALGALFLFATTNLYGHVEHVHHHLVWFTAILAMSRCGDALSVDAWWRRFRGGGPDPPVPAPCYGFPLRAMAVVLGVYYFCAGFWKVVVGGPAWIFSGHLAYFAAKQAFNHNGVDPAFGDDLIGNVAAFPWTQLLTSNRVLEPAPWLACIGGIFTIVFELGFLFAIWFPKGRLPAALAGVGFHNSTRVFAGIGFDELLLCYPMLFDVAGWARWLGNRLGYAAGANGDTAEAGTRTGAQPSAPLIAMAAFLILGNAAFGLLRIGSGWPLSCAPRFDVVHSPLYTSYVVSGVRPDGTRVHVRDAGLGGPVYGRRLREIFRGRQYHVAGTEQPEGRLRRWQILCAVVWNHHPSLMDATDVHFSLVDVDLSNGSEKPRVIGQRVLFQCNRG